jgi:hypothetical protein
MADAIADVRDGTGQDHDDGNVPDAASNLDKVHAAA